MGPSEFQHCQLSLPLLLLLATGQIHANSSLILNMTSIRHFSMAHVYMKSKACLLSSRALYPFDFWYPLSYHPRDFNAGNSCHFWHRPYFSCQGRLATWRDHFDKERFLFIPLHSPMSLCKEN